MSRVNRNAFWGGLGALLVFSAGMALGIFLDGPGAKAQTSPGGPSSSDLADRVAALEAALTLAPARTLAALPVPTSATLCGQPVPLDRPEVRENLAYELVLTIGRPLMPLLWMRRAPGVLPMIESKLREKGYPDDLKYLAMIESDLRWTNRSPAGAVGLWQFMQATGGRYGLRVDRFLDERMDPEKSTDAALRHLGDLHKTLGDWFLALSAYNAGEGTVRHALTDQGRVGYFDMYLPAETRRYIYRLLAAKLVMESPERFGLVTMRPVFVPRFQNVQVEAKGAGADLRTLCRERGWNYLGVRIANPQVLGATLPKGRYTLRIPDPATPSGVGN